MNQLRDKIYEKVIEKVSVLISMFENNKNTVLPGIYFLTEDYGLKAAPFNFKENLAFFEHPDIATEIAKSFGAKAVMLLKRESEYQDEEANDIAIRGRFVTGEGFIILSRFNENQNGFEKPIFQYLESFEIFQADKFLNDLFQRWDS